MTRAHPRRAAATALLALAGVLALPGAAGAAEVPGTVDSVQVQGDQVQFVLTAPTRTPGGTVDPAAVAVTVGGRPAATTSAVTSGEQVERRLVLLIDVSGSMRDGGIAAAQLAARSLVRSVAPDVQVGLVVFDDDARVLVPPTTDRGAVLAAVDGLTAQEETALYDGVAAAVSALGQGADRTLVLLSDGGDTVSVRTLQATELLLAQSGVRAQVVGFRTDETQDGVLQALATAGRGTVSTAQDGAGLTEAFAAVATVLSSQVQVVATLPDGAAGEQAIRVEAVLGPDRVVAESTVRLPAAAPRAPTAAPAPAPPADVGVVAAALPPWLRTPWPATALATAFGLAALLLLLVVAPRRQQRPVNRLEQLAYYSIAGREVDAVPVAQEPRRSRPVAEAAEEFVRRRGLEEGLAALLDRADLPWRPHEYVVLRVAAAVAATAVSVVLVDAWPVHLLAPFLGWAAVTAYVRVRARRRVATFALQLPDALALVGSSLQTGFSLAQALDAVARDTAEPLRGQLTRALAESRLGADLEDALERVADRMRCQDLSWTVMAIRIQREVGGNLAQTLRTTTDTLRERSSLRRQVQALSADGRISAYVLLALPPLLAVGLTLVRPEYVQVLWTRPIGLLLVAVGVVGMVVGTVWIRQLVKVEL